MYSSRIILWLGVFILMGSGVASAQSSPDGKSLAGTSWVGKEDLEGFGKLTFTFAQEGKVTMIDAKATTQGTYAAKDAAVELTFPGGVIYSGKTDGKTLSGHGKDKIGFTWKFQVSQAADSSKPGPEKLPAASATKPGAAGPGAKLATIPSGPAPTTGSGPSAPGTQGAPGKSMDQQVLEAFTKAGLPAILVTPDVGPSYAVLTIKEEGWTFIVEVKQQKSVWLVALLDPLPQGANDLEKMMRLLEANDQVSPCFFFFRAADRRLCMKVEILSPSNQKEVMSDLRTLISTVRSSHALWNTATWTKEMPAAVAQGK